MDRDKKATCSSAGAPPPPPRSSGCFLCGGGGGGGGGGSLFARSNSCAPAGPLQVRSKRRARPKGHQSGPAACTKFNQT